MTDVSICDMVKEANIDDTVYCEDHLEDIKYDSK